MPPQSGIASESIINLIVRPEVFSALKGMILLFDNLQQDTNYAGKRQAPNPSHEKLPTNHN